MDVPTGVSFWQAVGMAKELIWEQGLGFVDFTFNDIDITYNRYSCDDDIAKIYDLKCELRRIRGY